MKRSLFTRLLACVLVLAVVLFAALPVFAAPARPDTEYILDEAGVLSSDTVRSLQQRSASLYAQTGAELDVVVTNDTGSDIQDYAEDIYKSWNISNAGILLVLSIQEDDYYALYGSAVTNYFKNDIQDILYDPQTSGGLLMALPEDQAQACLDELREQIPQAAIIGSVTERLDQWIYLDE